MKALILCGGQGTRLREHTEDRPKPMVDIGGRPILWHIMKTYAHYGVTDFVLCLGYKGHVIKDYFLKYETLQSDFTLDFSNPRKIEYHGSSHAESNWRVTLADTGEHAMTGARIARAAKYLDSDDDLFCATYGDGVADVNLREVIDYHRSHGGLATITGVRPPSRFGELEVDGRRVTSFSEKPQVSTGLINGGYFVFSRGFLKYLSVDDGCILERAPLEACAADGELFIHEHAGYWQCMDTYRDWADLNRQWTEGEAPWAVWNTPPRTLSFRAA